MRTARRACLALIAAAGPAAAQSRPYDAMAASFGVHVDATGWADKVRAVSRDEYHFWRGTRDLFYAWCGEHCRDWLDDPSTFVVSHGDLHWGNLGSYAAAGAWGELGYGLVDFDESARLPFQLDMLQGLVTFELIARENGFPLARADRERLRAAVFDAYVTPAADSGLRKVLKDRSGEPYADAVTEFTDNGRFRSEVRKRGVVTNTLRPIDAARRDALASALAEAAVHDARLAALLAPYDATDFRAIMLDAAERTRVDSSGSQGLSKILVLLHKPFRGRDEDGLLYLKQQLPAAAERVGIVPPVDGPPARRYVRDLDTLTHGRALAASWCEFEAKSYWVSVKEPWSDEPDYKAVRDLDTLLAAARVWARVVAEAHGDAADRLRPRLTPAVRDVIARRADDYVAWQTEAYARFINDSRVRAAGGMKSP